MSETHTQTTLGECCSIVSGATPSTGVPEYWDGGVPWATPKDLSRLEGLWIENTERTLTEAGLSSCSSALLPENSVLLSSRAPIGYVAINTRPMATNQGFKSLVPKDNLVDARYLAYWLRAKRPQLEALGNGATFKEVSKAVISRVPISLPPLPEQRRIADLLDRADAIRRKREEALAMTDELLRATFLDMFGDPVTNPNGWPAIRLGCAAEVRGGVQVSPIRHQYSQELPYLRVANVMRGRLDLTEVKSIGVRPAEVSKILLQKGDVLIVEGHGNAGELGRAAVWSGTISPCTHQNHIIRARPDPTMIFPEYLAAFLNSSAGRSQMLRFGKTTSGLNTISTGNVRGVVVLTPPLSRQQQYASTVGDIKRLRDRYLHALEDVAKLRCSLAQTLLKHPTAR